MRKRLYYYPPLKGGPYGNPYSDNYREALSRRFRIVNIPRVPHCGLSISFFFASLRADVYVLNWLEDISYRRFGHWQFALAKLGLWIIRQRGKQVVWMFHNMQPHDGHSVDTRWLHRYLFRHAQLIISHSQEAAAFARRQAEGRVEYVCHPVTPFHLDLKDTPAPPPCDVLIWGTVVPYKGVAEFLAEARQRQCPLRIRVLGKCPYADLTATIEGLCGGDIVFDNRRASFEELAMAIRASRVVLFPYVGGSISSSGALIDTVALGGTPVGPRRGAFKDLSDEGVCLTYNDYDDLFRLLTSQRSIDPSAREAFIEANTWTHLAEVVEKYMAD